MSDIWSVSWQLGILKLRKMLFLSGGILLLLLVSACGALGGSELDRAEQKWLQQSVASYRINVLSVRSTWHAQTNTVNVRASQVVDSSAECIPAPAEGGKCQIEAFDPNAYTIPGLFETARARLASDQAKWIKITFDPSNGYPSQISYNNPNIIDGDWSLRVTAFEVLK
jgi:hypothetical protein